jgi:hypothetical protein
MNNVFIVTACVTGLNNCKVEIREPQISDLEMIEKRKYTIMSPSEHNYCTMSPRLLSKNDTINSVFNDVYLYYNNSRSRQLTDHTRRDWRQKEDSLAAKFNSVGGNNHMWDYSINFLDEIGLYRLKAVLQDFVPRERTSCLAHNSIISSSQSNGNILYKTVDKVKVGIQHLYDKECGILSC